MTHRRNFLKKSLVLVPALSLPMIGRAASNPQGDKTLRLYNTHTGESVRSVFWEDGRFVPDELAAINKVLRDHRSNTVAAIDPQLLLLLDRVSSGLGDKNVLHVISGYRSPQSNQLLAERGSGVAKHSLHMDGKAIDIRIPGRDLGSLRKAALSLRGGGVGYYPDSQFVHMDTGRLRSW